MSREQPATQYRRVGQGFNRRARCRCDVGGHRVGLLRGQAGLLDRVVGGVARGVDGVDAGDAAVLVYRNVPARVRRQALEPWTV